MEVSYSLHISSKSHSINNVAKIVRVGKHNLRAYTSQDYDRDQIEVLRGSNNSLLDDVRKIYHQEFDAPVKEYNSKQKRADRMIKDYLNELSQKQSDIAVEIIIQIGNADYWLDKAPEDKRKMTTLFKDQLKELERLNPNFKIANAVIHYDEKSPHMHVIGVPVAQGYTKGLSKRVSKTRVFTRESLSMLQDKMRAHAKQCLDQIGLMMDFKPKEKGRNRDIPKYALTKYYEVLDRTAKKQDEVYEMDGQLREKLRAVHKLDKTLSEKSAYLKSIDKKISEHEDLRDVIAIYNQAYDDEIEVGDREIIHEEDLEI